MSVGAGFAGLRSMTSTSGPGLSLMAEYLGLAKSFRISRDRLTLALEAEANLEGLGLTSNYGVEYGFRNVLFGRLGVYRGNFTFGLGLRIKRFHVDYGYAQGVAPDSRDLGSPQQVSGGFEF
jgi:hypothetical protein